MRKIFTFLFAALMSVGMYATTVTWNNNDITGSWGNSFTKDGVTVNVGEFIDFDDKNFFGGGTFTTTLGNFTKIEVSCEDCGASGTGWSGNYSKKTWTGNASSVSFSGNIVGMGMGIQFVFTIEDPTVAVTGVTLNQNAAEMTVGGETLTLTATVNPDNATDKSVTWSTSDANVATVENGVVTAVAAGTATITATATNGTPDDTTDDFSATCDVTVSAPAPQPVTDPITPYADPQDASVYYSTFYDSNFKYELPADVEAYVADLSGANLLLTKIAEAGEVIPANVAVILKSTVTSFTLTVSDADAVTFTATNDLQGSDTQIATPANCYVLAGTDGVVGFYHYTAANLNAHKAYVVYSGSNQAPRRMPFIFDQATGVENVQNSDIRSQKVVENGQLIIIRNGVRYNAAGQNVK